jgi:CRP/FNR family cyclic AMP-dependent transcriptional regulator
MSIAELLQRCELFSGLTVEQIERIAALGQEVVHNAGDVIINEGDPSDEIYVVCDGTVEVEVSRGTIPDVPGPPQLSSLVRLGHGQVFGEMALVDRGARSATVRCVENGTALYVIPREDFWELCESDHHIGYVVMRNIAADLSFKLRHRNLQMGLTGGAA